MVLWYGPVVIRQGHSQNNGEVYLGNAVSGRGFRPFKGVNGAQDLEAHGLYNRKGDVFFIILDVLLTT